MGVILARTDAAARALGATAAAFCKPKRGSTFRSQSAHCAFTFFLAVLGCFSAQRLQSSTLRSDSSSTRSISSRTCSSSASKQSSYTGSVSSHNSATVRTDDLEAHTVAGQKPQTGNHRRRLAAGSESQTQYLVSFLDNGSPPHARTRGAALAAYCIRARTTLHTITHEAPTHSRTRTR
jgi:hypothetical protein